MKEHGSTPGKAIPDNLNRYFDSTLLKPEATERQIENLCREAITDDFFAVCVNPFYVQTAKAALSKYKGAPEGKGHELDGQGRAGDENAQRHLVRCSPVDASTTDVTLSWITSIAVCSRDIQRCLM